uniref:Calcium voltage-gated channel auxiliary subunit alpha2delta 4 n=1 Tax=Callorhinchus milii TaxID=7868 RepID=A0A4W3K8X8_CALMI
MSKTVVEVEFITSFKRRIRQLFEKENSTGYGERLKYKDVESIIKIKDVDGMELVKNFGATMEQMLGRKVEAVKRLVDAAEDADLYHEFNAELGFDYYNSVLINEKDSNGNYVMLGNKFILEENEHFNNLPVNTSLSNIQVPTNVYNEDPNIVNGAYWSETLNEIFSDNFMQDPTLTWQYFGSSTGFFRLYPGIKWMPDENGVISFDCRNRGWYIQAATSPKDIIILLDISGSMKGLRMTIAKHTITSILDTLGENDFVNIVAYNDYVHYVEPCFKGTLVQADRDNREHFKQLVGDLHAKGTGIVNKGLIESFRILNEFKETGQGSLCNQAIMLITDGAVEEYEQVFEKYNWPDRKVRVFTYLIGREVTFADYVKWIACNNKGYYTHISTLADVQENVMEYLHVLSRPMVINHDHDIIWTEAYMDSALFQTAAESLLLMTTVAMPVFSKKNETRAHGILLGVAGSDVPLRELLKLAPRYKYKDGAKLKPKPNYNSVDILDVEWEDKDEFLRTALVNGETGMLSMDVRVPVDKGKRVLFLTNDYFYIHIADTPFSLCVVLSRGHGEYIFVGNVSVEEGLHDLLQPDVSLADEWIYCVTDIDPDHRKLSQLEAVTRYLTGEDPDLDCDEELVQEVLFDAVVTAPLEAYWTAIAMNTSETNEDGIEMAFLGTRAGLMRKSLFVGKEKLTNQKFLTTGDKENIFTLDHFPLWRNHFVLIFVSRVKLYDYQAMCKVIQHHHSGAQPMLSVSICRSVLMLHIRKHRKQELFYPCETEYLVYTYDPTIKETNGLIECGDCQKMFVVQQIVNSNLLMLVSDANCDCSMFPPVTLEPTEVKYILYTTFKCERMRSQKLRRRPNTCHAFHPEPIMLWICTTQVCLCP